MGKRDRDEDNNHSDGDSDDGGQGARWDPNKAASAGSNKRQNTSNKEPSFGFSVFPPKSTSLSFGFQKPAASLVKEAESGKTLIWEVRQAGNVMTIRSGPEDELGASEDKKLDTAEEAASWLQTEVKARKAEGYTEKPASDAPKPFAGLFGSFAGEKKPEVDVKEPPKFQGLFKSFTEDSNDEKKDEKKDSGGFGTFSTPSGFGSGFGGGFGGSSGFGKISFASAGSTSLAAEPAPSPTTSGGGGFSGLFGSTDATTEGGEKTSFGTHAGDAEPADLTKALQEKAQEGTAGEASTGSEAAPAVTISTVKEAATSELPDVELKTGEEGEERLYEAQDTKLYMFKKEGGESKWKECGRGSLRVNKNKEKGRCRIIMRRKKTNQLALNELLWPDMMCQLVGEKEVRISFKQCGEETGEDGAAEGTIQMYSVRVLRAEGGAKQLEQVIQANKTQ